MEQILLHRQNYPYINLKSQYYPYNKFIIIRLQYYIKLIILFEETKMVLT